jgi:hypothetical protein
MPPKKRQHGGSLTMTSVPVALMVLKSMVDKYIRDSSKPRKPSPAQPKPPPFNTRPAASRSAPSKARAKKAPARARVTVDV